MGSDPLSIDVYVAPTRPYTCPDELGEAEVATWAPSSSTLISGPTEGILIDALLTFENAARSQRGRGDSARRSRVSTSPWLGGVASGQGPRG
jgi:hypothetical protein